jgi:hypothetical protein
MLLTTVVSPMALVAFANELMNLAPSAAADTESPGDASAFANLLIDVEASEETAPVEAAEAERTDRPSWLIPARRFAAEPIEEAEPEQKVSLDLAFPTYTVPPVIDVCKVPVSIEVPEIGPIVLPESAAQSNETIPAPPAEAKLVDEPLAALQGPAQVQQSAANEMESPLQEPVAPVAGRKADLKETRQQTKPRKEANASLVIPQPAPLPAAVIESPESQPDTRTPQAPQPASRTEPTGASTFATPAKIVLDAMIRPEAPSVAVVDFEAPVRIAASTIAPAAETKQQFADSSDGEQTQQELTHGQVPAFRQAAPGGASEATPVQGHAVAAPSASFSAMPSRDRADVARTVFPETKEQPPATPLKRMEVRIPNPQSDVVVHVQEHKGAVQVTVRTDDARTAGAIATHLPELSHDLGQQGFHSTLWTPEGLSEGMQPASKSSTASDPSDLTNSGNTGEQSRNHRDRDHDTEQRRRRAPQEDLEEYLW